MERPPHILPAAWQKISPHMRAALEKLHARGHVVTVKLNRIGMVRYSVGDLHKMDAATLLRRFKLE